MENKQNNRVIWRQKPSQWVNFGVFFFASLTFFLIIPPIYAFWRYLVVKNEVYELTEDVLTLSSGVFNKRVDDVQLYRVKDMRLERPFLLRLVGLGNIHLISSDQTNPDVTFKAIKNSEPVRAKLRELVEKSRSKLNVREIDTFDFQ